MFRTSDWQNKRSLFMAIIVLMLAIIACGGGSSAVQTIPASEQQPINESRPTGETEREEPVATTTQASAEIAQPAPEETGPQEPVESEQQQPVESVPEEPVESEQQQPVESVPKGPIESAPQEPVESELQQSAETGPLEPVETMPQDAADAASQDTTGVNQQNGPSEEESAAIASLKEEIFGVSVSPLTDPPCDDFGAGEPVVLEPPPVLIRPTLELLEIEPVVPTLPGLVIPPLSNEPSQLVATIVSGLVLTRPLVLVDPVVIEATSVPPKLRVVAGTSTHFCLAGVPRDEEMVVSLQAPNRRFYQESFFWATGSNGPQWVSPQNTAVIKPISAVKSSLEIIVRTPLGPFPAGTWSVNISGGGVNLNGAIETYSTPKIAIPDFAGINPFSVNSVQTGCVSYSASSVVPISIVGAGFDPGTIVPIGFYGNYRLVNAKAVTIAEDGRFRLEVAPTEFDQPGIYHVVAVLDPGRDGIGDNPRASCFTLE